MTCVAPRHGDSSRDGILATYSCCSLCLKKNQNAPRPSEHPPVKTFRWDHRLFVVRALCFYLYFLRTINTINTVPGIYLIIATWEGGGGLRCQTFSFLFSFPCSADHERNTGMLLCIVKYSNCRFLGLATNQYAECEKQERFQTIFPPDRVDAFVNVRHSTSRSTRERNG